MVLTVNCLCYYLLTPIFIAYICLCLIVVWFFVTIFYVFLLKCLFLQCENQSYLNNFLFTQMTEFCYLCKDVAAILLNIQAIGN